MAPPLININDIHLTFGGNDLFSDVSFAIGERDRLCLVGRNGGGKSTLLKIIAGEIEADGGERFVQPGCKVAYLNQEPKFDGFDTVEEFVLSALDDHEQEYKKENKSLNLKIERKRTLNWYNPIQNVELKRRKTLSTSEDSGERT